MVDRSRGPWAGGILNRTVTCPLLVELGAVGPDWAAHASARLAVAVLRSAAEVVIIGGESEDERSVLIGSRDCSHLERTGK